MPALRSVFTTSVLAVTQLWSALPPFPCKPGTIWLYRLHGQSAAPVPSDKPITREEFWTMEILDQKQVGDYLMLKVRGSIFQIPPPFEWASRKPTPELGLLVLGSRGGVYAPEADVAKVWPNELEALAKGLNGNSLIFRWPAKPQDRWGEAPPEKRSDAMYQWHAERWSQLDYPIPGWWGTKKGLDIALQTLPDHFRFTFIPGLGITRMEYAHHGTIGEYEARLMRIQAPKSRKGRKR